jgi:hypothetical protein
MVNSLVFQLTPQSRAGSAADAVVRSMESLRHARGTAQQSSAIDKTKGAAV